jgi:hypothetical protein
MKNKQQWIAWILATLRESAWAPLGVVGIYIVGLALHLFRMFPFIDMPTHFLGGMAITYFYRSAIRNSQTLLGPTPHLLQVLFAFTATGTTAVLWEFYENLIDHFFGTHMVRGLEDTIIDLAMGLSGALVLSVFYRKK